MSPRSTVLSCAHTTLAFVSTRVWSRCKEWPWKLAIGDIPKNIDDLAAMETPPEESVARKVWYLANHKFPREQLLEGVQLLQHLGWTSTTVEQIHASATLVVRVHPTYGILALCARALMHTSRLFFTVDPLDREAEKLSLRLQEQLEGKTGRIPPQCMLFKQVMELQKFKGQQRWGASGSGLTGAQIQRRMVLSSDHWKKTDEHRREALRKAARIEEVKRAHQKADALVKTELQLREVQLKKKLQKMSQLPPKLIFSSCTFGPRDEQCLSELFHGGCFEKTRVQQLRKAAMEPGLLPKPRLAQMDQISLVQQTSSPGAWWLPVVAICRTAFKHSAIVVGTGPGARFYKFLFAKKSPRQAAFCPLTLQEPEHVAVYKDDFFGADQCSELLRWKFVFTCDRMDIRESGEVDPDPDSQIYVLTGLVDKGDQVVSDGPMYILSDFVQGLRELDLHKRPGLQRVQKTKEQKQEWERLLSLHPWLAQKVVRRDAARAKRARTSSDVPTADDGEDEGLSDEVDEEALEALEDEDIATIFENLAKMREHWKATFASLELPDFTAGVLGGPSTLVATSSAGKEGAIADFICCEATSQDAKAFAKAYDLRLSKRASISLYGMGPATTLTEAWGHRMQYYLDVYRTSGDPMYRFTVGDHNAYVAPKAFTTLAEMEDKVRDVVVAIRGVMPFSNLRPV